MPVAFADLPADHAVLARATVPACLIEGALDDTGPDRDGLLLVDLELCHGRIAAIAPAGSLAPTLDLGRRMVWPCPIDIHTHLDKGHIWPRAANPDGSFWSALETVRRDRERHWSAADVAARMSFGLRCSWAQGTRAIRTHLDSIPPQAEISWPVFAALRTEWAGRIELQAVSLAMNEHYRGPDGERLADLVAEHGGILGLVPLPGPELAADLDRFFALAIERGLEIDCHIDESLDPGATTLEALARAALRNGYHGRILAGHCCALSVQEPGYVAAVIDLLLEAGIGVVSLPMCNLYLQDRAAGRTPRRRGVTLLHELAAAGVPVMLASDNCRDPFYAYGDHDLWEVFREGVRIAHLDHPIGVWPRAVTSTPAAWMGLAEAGRIRPGAPADLVIFEGRTWSEVLARPESGRTVLRAGRPIDRRLPSYAELDFLFA
ncbi:MAG: cytosine deaminase [Geminicoccaceae bacterium]|nr:cytosine deaminase [Geminicoccaceae bacterium]